MPRPINARRAARRRADMCPRAARVASAVLALLLGLTACAPASPVAPAPTAPPTATLAPLATLPPAPTAPLAPPTATPTPRLQLTFPADSPFTPAEQTALQARLDAPPAEWGYDPATTDIQVARGGDERIYLTLSHKPTAEGADPEPQGRIIILESLTGPAIAFADLAGAQAATEANGQPPVSYIMVDYENQVVGVDESGQTVMIFDIDANTWGPAFTPIAPESTATPETVTAEGVVPYAGEFAYLTNGGVSIEGGKFDQGEIYLIPGGADPIAEALLYAVGLQQGKIDDTQSPEQQVQALNAFKEEVKQAGGKLTFRAPESDGVHNAVSLIKPVEVTADLNQPIVFYYAPEANAIGRVPASAYVGIDAFNSDYLKFRYST